MIKLNVAVQFATKHNLIHAGVLTDLPKHIILCDGPKIHGGQFCRADARWNFEDEVEVALNPRQYHLCSGCLLKVTAAGLGGVHAWLDDTIEYKDTDGNGYWHRYICHPYVTDRSGIADDDGHHKPGDLMVNAIPVDGSQSIQLTVGTAYSETDMTRYRSGLEE